MGSKLSGDSAYLAENVLTEDDWINILYGYRLPTKGAEQRLYANQPIEDILAGGVDPVSPQSNAYQRDNGSGNGSGTESVGLGWNTGTLNAAANLGKFWTGIEANKIAQEQTDATKQHLGHRMEMDKLNAAMKYYDAQVALDNRKHNLATRGIDIPVYELPDSVFRPEFTKVG